MSNTSPNAKADQRRTTISASPLDSIRRLIQRLVRPPTGSYSTGEVRTKSHVISATTQCQSR
jgi:hypothetical protein